jgi:hypothetical protein
MEICLAPDKPGSKIIHSYRALLDELSHGYTYTLFHVDNKVLATEDWYSKLSILSI